MKAILNGRSLILASASPRRSQLLTMADIPFTSKVFPVDESYPADLIPEAVAEYIALKKAAAHVTLCKKNQIVLCADTVVLLNNEILGKAKSAAEARETLSKLSGRQHQVITGVSLQSLQKQVSFSAITNVKIAPLTEGEIDFYLENYKPYDKAGAYGIQDWIGICKVERIEGLYTNVMGLPVEMLYQELQDF